MDQIIELALTYGGFTRLDRTYLRHVLAGKSPSEQLEWITPPPSVINAYFAEMYQKQSPQAAMDYFFDLSQALHLFQEAPSFEEIKPFIRLNLSGSSFGFAFSNAQREGVIFPEVAEDLSPARLYEMAQIFPGYWVRAQGQVAKLAVDLLLEREWTIQDQSAFLLTEIARSDDWMRISGLNLEEVEEAAQQFSSQEVYRAWQNRSAIIYLHIKK